MGYILYNKANRTIRGFGVDGYADEITLAETLDTECSCMENWPQEEKDNLAIAPLQDSIADLFLYDHLDSRRFRYDPTKGLILSKGEV